MTRIDSHRQILKSTSIIGSASVLQVLIGIVNAKVLAVLLGPPGLALLGLYQNILNVASTLSGCGLGNSGVRQIAATADDAATLALVRRTLRLGMAVMGLTGMATLFMLRERVALLVFGSSEHATEVGWLGVGLLFALLSSSQTATLKGLRRIRDLAQITITGALTGAVAGCALVLVLGTTGVLFYVIVAPVASYLVARRFVNRLPDDGGHLAWQQVGMHWKAMLGLGIPLMTATLLTAVAQLVARSLVLRELGLEGAGHFQAAWAVSMSCIGFVLGAMGTDYYPRITGSIHDHSQARRLVNEQTEMGLLLAGPVLLGLVVLAPWVIDLLYSRSFRPAAEMLRWQIVGDMLKAATWPMAFVLLAKGRGVLVIFTEAVWNAVYLGVLWTALETHGLPIAGIAYLVAYTCYCLLMSVLVHRLIGLRSPPRSLLMLSGLLVAGTASILLADLGRGGTLAGLLLVLSATVYSALRLNSLLHLRTWLSAWTRRAK